MKFVTLFPLTTNIHLIKDIGMIPYFLHKKYGYESSIVTYKCTKDTYITRGFGGVTNIIDDSYSYLDNEVRGLKLEFIKDRGFFKGLEIGVILWLIRKSSSTDILHLFHLTFNTFVCGLIYKLFNPKGKLYLKVDADLEQLNAVFKQKGRIQKKIRTFFFAKVDVVSSETQETNSFFIENLPLWSNKFLYLPNGVDITDIDEFSSSTKENIFVTVGRIGTAQKNTELFLEALTNIDIKDWKVYFIGLIDAGFDHYIETFYQKNPDLCSKVFFTGNISDRKQLYQWYNKAKVFVLTSNYESYCIALVEAAIFGNFIISTRVGVAEEITQNGVLGDVIELKDRFALQERLQHIIDNPSIIEQKRQKIMESALQYSWGLIIEKLYSKLLDT